MGYFIAGAAIMMLGIFIGYSITKTTIVEITHGFTSALSDTDKD